MKILGNNLIFLKKKKESKLSYLNFYKYNIYILKIFYFLIR